MFSYEVLNKYNRLIDGQNRTAKTDFFDKLYDDEFFKLNVEHLFMLNQKKTFNITKANTSKKTKISPPHEMIIHD